MDAMKEEMENVGLKVEKAGVIGRYSAVAIPVGSSQKKMTRENKILEESIFFFFFCIFKWYFTFFHPSFTLHL